MIKTLQLTTAQAIVKYLSNQYIDIDGKEKLLCGGGFAIFGHGNVPCLGEALYPVQDILPTYRGQNEQSMALAACGYAKYYLRRRFMFATSSAGPGTSNLLTASALAHANRLPLLLLSGDNFITRLSDPVLQQLEHYHDSAMTLTDAFRATVRYFDRISHPAQILQSLPQAIGTMLDAATCGPAFIGLPQDAQGWVFDYPEKFFQPRTHIIRRQSADQRELDGLVERIKAAKRPLLVAGGGVQYSQACPELARLAQQCAIPVVETIAGRANMLYEDKYNAGPLGTTGSDSANFMAQNADLIIAIGTRLQDFTTGSWTVFAPDTPICQVNVSRYDATKHQSLSVVADAKLVLQQLLEQLQGYQTEASWQEQLQNQKQSWHTYLLDNTDQHSKSVSSVSYAKVVGVVNKLASEDDRVVAAAGGLPAEICANWRTKGISTVDIEFGYSCMGYEIAGGWGAAIAQSECNAKANCFVLLGDGSYLMMNSDIYSSVLTGKKMIVIVCDNQGFAVINKLQNNTGNVSFNNQIADCKIAGEPFSVDFAAHATAMGAYGKKVSSLSELHDEIELAKVRSFTSVLVINVEPFNSWTERGHAWWQVGVAQRSDNPQVQEASTKMQAGFAKQRQGI